MHSAPTAARSAFAAAVGGTPECGDCSLGRGPGYCGIMEKKMETTVVGLYRDYYIRVILRLYWDYIGIMEKKKETTLPWWLLRLWCCGCSSRSVLRS